MILNDREIMDLCQKDVPMLNPFIPGQVKDAPSGKLISFGLSSFGYDIRVDEDFKIFTNVHSAVVDPKNLTADNFVDVRKEQGSPITIPPNSFTLCRSHEYLVMPDDVMAICIGKSTYARCGLVVNVTPIEPGWEGHITIEISNTTPNPARVYPMEGIAQLVFFRGHRPQITYGDRAGKYQGQKGVTLPRV